MKSKRPRGVRVIISVTLLLVVVILILGNQSFRATEQAAFDEFNQRQLVLAKGAAGGIELYFETLAGDMRTLARIPEIQRLAEAPTRREMQRRFDELESRGVNDIAVLDANGVARYNVIAHQIEGVDFSWRNYYQEAKKMSSNDAYIIEFIEFKGVEIGQKGVLIAVPMFEAVADNNSPSAASRFAGVVVGTLKLDAVTQKFIAPIQASERGHAFLIDDEYNLLWTADSSLFGKNLLAESESSPSFQQLVERMAAGGTGAAEYTHYKFEDSVGRYAGDEEEKLVAYAPIQLGRELWTVGVWAPKEDAQQLIRSVYFKQLFIVGLSVLVILLGSGHTLAVSLRFSKALEKEVEAKAGELQNSHRRLLTVLESLDAAVYVADMETYEILFANEHTRDLWGDAVGKTCWQVLQAGQVGPCDFCTNGKLLTTGGKPGGVYKWESWNTVTNRWYEIRDRAIRWVDGRIVRLEIAIDVTERKAMEETLRESEDRYRRLVELSPDAIGIQSEDELVFMNSAGANLFGAENPGQLIGKSVWDFVLPKNRALVQERYRQIREKGVKAPRIEQQFIRLDGTPVDVEVTAIPFIYKGKPAIQAIFHDITRRKQIEKSLKVTQAFQQAAIDGVAQPIMVIGADYRVKLMNRAARQFLPGDVEASEPVFCYQLFSHCEAPCEGIQHPCPMEEVRQSGQPGTVVHEHYRADGERRLVEVIASPLWGEDGAFEGIIETIRDVTGRKSAEDALAQEAQVLALSNDELEEFAHKVVKSLQNFFVELE